MKKFRYLSPLAGLLTLASPVYAQNLGVGQPEGFQITDLGLLIERGIQVALILAGILVFVFLVWGGIQWIMSGGDKAKTEEARNRITAALVGLAIVAAAWAIMQIVATFFGLNLQGEVPQGY